MTRPKKLLVIDPSVAFPETECVATILRDWPGVSRVLEPALRPGDGPAPGYGYDVDGIVLLGSRASALDDLPWLGELAAWLDPVLDGREPIPLLGICFGHQLMAQRCGGEVGFVHPDRATEMGIRDTVLDGGRLVPGTRRIRVVASHREEVKKLPPGFRVVARRPAVEVDGMEHDTLPLFGFQFHPEARAPFLEMRGLEGTRMEERMIADSERILSAFRHLVLAEGR